MQKTLSVLFAGIIVSFYFFTISFVFLPEGINTKIILALIGMLIFVLRSGAIHTFNFTKELVYGMLLATLFSLLCYMSSDFNHTDDYSYADYIVSFFVWVYSAYTVGYVLFKVHGEFTISLLTKYLAGVSVFQCISAIMIDNIPAFKSAVDSVVEQGATFVESVHRLYGIGASLDPAGVRFSIVLIMIAYVILKDERVRHSTSNLIFLISSFIIISIVGNMISRTTTTGMLIGLASLILFSNNGRLVIKRSSFKMIHVMIGTFVTFIGLSIFLYNNDPFFYEQLRFGFEGFFNWAETGEWRTDSTDKLNTVMWVWPTNFRDWMIGTGLFANFVYSTDIGYCRFVMYCGLIGFGTFVLFFIVNAAMFMRKFPPYRLLFLSLLALGFIIWVKVATDIFLIFALFYWLNEDSEEDDEEDLEEPSVQEIIEPVI